MEGTAISDAVCLLISLYKGTAFISRTAQLRLIQRLQWQILTAFTLQPKLIQFILRKQSQ